MGTFSCSVCPNFLQKMLNNLNIYMLNEIKIKKPNLNMKFILRNMKFFLYFK